MPPDAIIVGSQTRLDSPEAIALDSSGKIYVANAGYAAVPEGESGSVTVYPPGSSGNVTPIAVIRGARALVTHPVGLAVDRSGTIYLVNANGMTVYPRGANGNVAPIVTLDASKIGIGGARNLVGSQSLRRFNNLSRTSDASEGTGSV